MTELRAIAAKRPERTKPGTAAALRLLFWIVAALALAGTPAVSGESWALSSPSVSNTAPAGHPGGASATQAENDRSYVELSKLVSFVPASGDAGDDALIAPPLSFPRSCDGSDSPNLPTRPVCVQHRPLGFTSRGPPAAVLHV